MRTLRWIAFLPAAAIVGLIAGKSGDILGVLIFRGETWPSYLLSGFLLSGFFILVGFKIAPHYNTRVKWVLFVPCLAFGIMATIGGFLSNKPSSAFTGVGIIFAGFSAFAPKLKEILNHPEKKS
jgi:hypothetical protein